MLKALDSIRKNESEESKPYSFPEKASLIGR